MKPQAVIYDIGNVLIEWQPERYYDRVIGEDRRRAMFSEIDLHGMNELVDLGGHFTDTVYEWVDKYPEWADEIRLWHDKWIEIAAPEIPQSVRLLRALRANGVPVFALTNFGIQTFEQAEQVYPFLSEFDRRYISGHMNTVKPREDIYAQVEADCGVEPQALLFTDDMPKNIAAAQARGWQTHHFKGPQGWAERLVSDGLVTPDQVA